MPLLLAERQASRAGAATCWRSVISLTARGGSLDLIGDGLGVPRLLPAPYRLDLDDNVLALYHLDDADRARSWMPPMIIPGSTMARCAARSGRSARRCR